MCLEVVQYKYVFGSSDLVSNEDDISAESGYQGTYDILDMIR